MKNTSSAKGTPPAQVLMKRSTSVSCFARAPLCSSRKSVSAWVWLQKTW